MCDIGILDICLIDDTIPAARNGTIDDTQRLNGSNLRLLLETAGKWQEDEVENLVNDLVNDSKSWRVSAFTHPELYMRAVAREGYRPDIIIYDWEYPGVTEDPATTLLRILEATYAVVYIYSAHGHEDQIESALNEEPLIKYKGIRLDVLMKSVSGSPTILLKRASDLYKKNFSFRFGRDLRFATLSAVEHVLVDFSKHDINFLIRLLAEEETEETDVKLMIVEKIMHHLTEDASLLELLTKDGTLDEVTAHSLLTTIQRRVMDVVCSTEIDLSSFGGQISVSEENKQTSRELWSHRLYYRPSDKVVRRGDVVCEGDSKRYYLVVTADCDLSRFWRKNFGYINLVPLYDLNRDCDHIRKLFGITRNENTLDGIIKKMCPNSLTGKIKEMVEGPFIMPFLRVDGDFFNFIGFPKEITSVKVCPPALSEDTKPDERKNQRLLYEHWKSVDRIATISEPFSTPIVQHCIDAIAGYGTPDYPEVVRNAVKDIIQNGLLKNQRDE